MIKAMYLLVTILVAVCCVVMLAALAMLFLPRDPAKQPRDPAN